MLKKIVKGVAAGAVALGLLAGSAYAADNDINIYGASAQHKFWLNLAPDFLASKGCSGIAQYAFDSKHGMAIGYNCTSYNNESVLIRYSSRASYDGINAVDDAGSRDMCDEATNCTSLTSVPVNLGASDVDSSSFNQATQGWEDGNQSFPGTLYTANATTLGFRTVSLPNFKPIVVPFGFLVNTAAHEYRCTRPEDANGVPITNKSYNKWDVSCVPDNVRDEFPVFECSDPAYLTRLECLANNGTWDYYTTPRGRSGVSADCLGFYQCINGTCNGGLNAGNACAEADDCPDVAVGDTWCQEMPIKNITQNMARQIFSGNVDNWSDFGPEYPDQAIVRCMRHAGSGTHATMDLAVMQGVAMKTISYPNAPNYTWHFTSSSDLTKCVTDFDGAIGYVDADKLMTFEDVGANLNNPALAKSATLAKYNGVYPTRRNIVWGLYEFWAAQHVYYDPAMFSGTLATIRADIEAYSSDEANLTYATLGNASYYWAAQAEMQVTRPYDGGPISHKGAITGQQYPGVTYP